VASGPGSVTMISNSSKGAVRNSGWSATERHLIGGFLPTLADPQAIP
jgi:hypothetical protein